MMQLIVSGLRKAVMASWGDLMNLIAFNIFYFLTLLPGLAFFSVTIADISMWTVAITAVLLFPSCLFLFALYQVAYSLNKDNVVKVVQFFQFIPQIWRQALTWGAINIAIVLIVIGNIVFYSQFGTAWAAIAQFLVLAVFMVWCVLQLFMLPMYPNLEDPGFKNALRNSIAITSQYGLPALFVAIVTAAILILTLLFQFLAFFFTFFTIAILSSSMLSAIINSELDSSDDSSS